jgi:hypothetical protein
MVNRSQAVLKHMFRMAWRHGKISQIPNLTTLRVLCAQSQSAIRARRFEFRSAERSFRLAISAKCGRADVLN